MTKPKIMHFDGACPDQDCMETGPHDHMHFDRACPFLLCPEVGPHDHGICPTCQAVRYGNLGCNACRAKMNQRHGWNLPMISQEELDEMKIPPPVTYSPTVYDVSQLLEEEATCRESK